MSNGPWVVTSAPRAPWLAFPAERRWGLIAGIWEVDQEPVVSLVMPLC